MMFDAQFIITLLKVNLKLRDPSIGCNEKLQGIPMVRIVCGGKITASKDTSVFQSQLPFAKYLSCFPLYLVAPTCLLRNAVERQHPSTLSRSPESVSSDS